MSLKRRTFLAASALAVTAPGLTGFAHASKMETFSADEYEKALASGEPFVVAVLSSW